MAMMRTTTDTTVVRGMLGIFINKSVSHIVLGSFFTECLLEFYDKMCKNIIALIFHNQS